MTRYEQPNPVTTGWENRGQNRAVADAFLECLRGSTRQSALTLPEALPDLPADLKSPPGIRCFRCLSPVQRMCSTGSEYQSRRYQDDQDFPPTAGADRLGETLGREHSPGIVMHDRDTKFTKEFTENLVQRGVRTNPLPKASPNLNGRCERFIETIKLECLNKVILFGKRHLNLLVSEFVDYYNHHHRSHKERDHLPPV